MAKELPVLIESVEKAIPLKQGLKPSLPSTQAHY